MSAARSLVVTAIAAGAVGLAAAPAPAQQSVVDTPHNLSASGPSAVHAIAEEAVCIFCHTAHDAAPIRPLWNRSMPVSAYSIYTSSALDARPGQPTGTSKMCLSCHDGTIALGSVLSRHDMIQMASGITTLPPGAANLGTDLSDDHPVSFRYDVALVVSDPKLAEPAGLPSAIRLDANQELQCTSCHDAHDDTHGDFLVMANQGSTLCRACHLILSTTVTAHDDCAACHQPHTAPSGPYLLRSDRITTSCLRCHDGSVPGAADVASELNRFSVHDTDSPVDPPEPIPGHSTCADCHEPHTMTNGAGSAPEVHPNFGQVSGISASGGALSAASYEYEVCYKCHADANTEHASWVPRVITQINTRLEFASSSVSYHPVQAPGRNSDVPSLKPPWTTSSYVYCSDCHGSDAESQLEQVGPYGVHGSSEAPLLAARYSTVDFTFESTQAYALCYRCHYRDGATGLLADISFPHSVHVSDNRTPCSVCHDAHGIAAGQGSVVNNSHLINFDNTVVTTDPIYGRLEYVDGGRFRGSCTLTCHGVAHEAWGYEQ